MMIQFPVYLKTKDNTYLAYTSTGACMRISEQENIFGLVIDKKMKVSIDERSWQVYIERQKELHQTLTSHEFFGILENIDREFAWVQELIKP